MNVYEVIFFYDGWGTNIFNIAIHENAHITAVFEIAEDLMRERIADGEEEEKFMATKMEYKSVKLALTIDNEVESEIYEH